MIIYDDSPLRDLLGHLERAERGIGAELDRTLEPEAEFLVERIKENVPVKTGELRDSVGFRHEGQGSVVIEATAPHALYVHERVPLENDPDGSTPEGGRGRKYLTRVIDVHHERLKEAAQKAAVKVLGVK